MNNSVHIWTDGSVVTNPGPGGWAAVLLYKGSAKVVGGYSGHATNNRMEAEAIVGGLSALRKACQVTIITDSNYVLFGLRRILDGKMPKTNRDVWGRVRQAVGEHQVMVEKTAGHADDTFNNLADAYAGHCAAHQTAVNEFLRDITRLLERHKRSKRKAS